MIQKRKFLILFIIPTLVGVSRIILGVHYPSDVFIGGVIGIFIPILILEIGKEFGRKV
jgi:membrane-associated phospholipid phosphatase